MAELAWLIPILPLASFVFISLAGQTVKGDGDRVGVAAVGASLILSILVFVAVLDGARVSADLAWAFFGGTQLRMGYQVDPFTATMLVMVTLISFLVHIYSLGYMHGDVRYKRYYAILSLFTASMLGLVLADNFLLLFIFWELIGLCSFLLIGHWYEKQDVGYAAMKAFLTTRVGDVGMFIGIMLIFFHARTFQFDGVAQAVAAGDFAGAALAVAAVLIFAGAIGKSAQFPLHVWLPDAMAGPTSVSALIHAATLVAAGVYLVARAYGIFAPSPTALTTVAWVGGITAIFAASIALVMEDIKKVLAYSTVSQLGFMMVALGVGGYTAGIFHLLTHAVFKALLFLASGSVIHGVDTQNMHEMGGLYKKMPITFWTWAIGSGALAGIYPLAGFWSKDEILLAAHEGGYTALFWILVIAAVFTAFYITRATILTFFGKPRDKKRFGRAHESPATMTVPLIVLAALAVVLGFANSPHTGWWFSHFVYFDHPHEAAASPFVLFWATASWVVGVGAAILVYGLGVISRRAVIDNLRPVWVLLKNKYYFDELYHLVFVRGTVAISRIVGWFDRVVIDGIVNLVGYGAAKLSRATGEFDLDVIDGAVNGIAVLVRSGGAVLRRLQTGYVQSYVLALFVTVVVGLLVFAFGG